ncbi:CMRF35-like molecule 5 [Polyodon spathula]|uniref:CMRF35-like molecule 5 n=1 Tax=Polyodon spathula TaxID=7913 RepID=UPI001B7E20E7|nr:CMRF35-like molecule 5 [Polyodon spathula]
MRLAWLLFGCLISVCLSHKVALQAGASLSVRCQYERFGQRWAKVWCRQSSPQHCSIVAATDQPDHEGRQQIQDNVTHGFITITMSDLQSSDSGVYYCGVHCKGRVYLLGAIEIQVSKAPRTQQRVSYPLTTTSMRRTSITTLSIPRATKPEENLNALQDREMDLSYSVLATLLACLLLVSLAVFIKGRIRYKTDLIRHKKTPFVMARFARRKKQENVYGATPRRDKVTFSSVQPRGQPENLQSSQSQSSNIPGGPFNMPKVRYRAL